MRLRPRYIRSSLQCVLDGVVYDLFVRLYVDQRYADAARRPGEPFNQASLLMVNSGFELVVVELEVGEVSDGRVDEVLGVEEASGISLPN